MKSSRCQNERTIFYNFLQHLPQMTVCDSFGYWEHHHDACQRRQMFYADSTFEKGDKAHCGQRILNLEFRDAAFGDNLALSTSTWKVRALNLNCNITMFEPLGKDKEQTCRFGYYWSNYVKPPKREYATPWIFGLILLVRFLGVALLPGFRSLVLFRSMDLILLSWFLCFGYHTLKDTFSNLAFLSTNFWGGA